MANLLEPDFASFPSAKLGVRGQKELATGGESREFDDLTVDATIFGVLTVPYHIQKCGRLVVFFYALPEVRLPGR